MALGCEQFGRFRLGRRVSSCMFLVLASLAWGQSGKADETRERKTEPARVQMAADKPATACEARPEENLPGRRTEPVRWWMGLVVLIGLIVFSGIVAMQPRESEMEKAHCSSDAE